MCLLLHSVLPAPQQATTDPRLSTRDSWTLLGKSGSVFCGITVPFCWVLVHTRFVWALWASLAGIGFDSKHEWGGYTYYVSNRLLGEGIFMGFWLIGKILLSKVNEGVHKVHYMRRKEQDKVQRESTDFFRGEGKRSRIETCHPRWYFTGQNYQGTHCYSLVQFAHVKLAQILISSWLALTMSWSSFPHSPSCPPY